MDAAFKYANDVISGELPACELVKLSALRFIADLERQKTEDFPFYFSQDAAGVALEFIQNLVHTKGEYAGRLLILQPWQVFIVANIFGWLHDRGELENKRRFTSSYVEVPRKNGKSTLASAIALCGLFLDGEQGAEIYSAATKLSQASIVFDESARACKLSDMLKDEDDLRVYNSVNNRVIKYGDSTYRPLEWSPKTQDGLNTHFAIVDEYHAHTSDELYNLIKNSMGARTQPHLHTVSTAGFNKQSPCMAHRKYCINVLRGIVQDDSIFAIIYTIDDDDDWRDSSTWKKANPNFGHSTYPRQFNEEFTKAKQSTSKEVEFKTKLLNVWTDSAEVWIRDVEFKAVEVESFDETKRVGECYLSLDLASTSDFCAMTLFFPETMHLFTEYFLPSEAVEIRNDATGDAIRQWVSEKLIHVTLGNVTDYSYIESRIDELMGMYQIKEVSYDKFNASQLIINLTSLGLTCYPWRQGYLSMNAPTKHLEILIKNKEITIEKNSCLRWMMGNVKITRDPADNIKIDKAKSGDKVDGPVSMVMAIGAWLENQKRDDQEEVGEFFFQKL
jgi:phage terminase large subunit-like protein